MQPMLQCLVVEFATVAFQPLEASWEAYQGAFQTLEAFQQMMKDMNLEHNNTAKIKLWK